MLIVRQDIPLDRASRALSTGLVLKVGTCCESNIFMKYVFQKFSPMERKYSLMDISRTVECFVRMSVFFDGSNCALSGTRQNDDGTVD